MYPVPMLYWTRAGLPAAAAGLYRRRGEAPPEERAFLDDLTEDVRARRPALIAIEAQPGCQGCPPEFNLLEYFRYNGFLDEVLAERYVEMGDAGKFRLYVRM
jgi:hypothetical protein